MKLFKKLTIASLILGTAFFIEGYRENRQLEKSYYTLKSDKLAHNNIKIAHLSDTQFPRLRVSKEKLLAAIANEKPDLIFFTGDLIDRTETIETSEFPYFLNKLTQIAPTYIVSGNHETSHPQYNEWLNLVKNSKATLLENEVREIDVKQEKINIIGLSDESVDIEKSVKHEVNPNLETFLLAHHPEKIKAYTKNLAPLSFTAFSGHAHGGQIILPGLGGILSPDQGFFPEYTDGVYQEASNHLVVSRGLANSSFPTRINNYPHLIFTTIEK